jgi:hypothetical protein
MLPYNMNMMKTLHSMKALRSIKMRNIHLTMCTLNIDKYANTAPVVIEYPEFLYMYPHNIISNDVNDIEYPEFLCLV